MARLGYISVRLEEGMDKLLEDYAKQNYLSVSQVVRMAIRSFFANLKKENQNG